MSAAKASTNKLFSRYPPTPLVQGVINEFQTFSDGIEDILTTATAPTKTPPATIITDSRVATERTSNVRPVTPPPPKTTGNASFCSSVPLPRVSASSSTVSSNSDFSVTPSVSTGSSTGPPDVGKLTYLLSKQAKNIGLSELAKENNLRRRRKYFLRFIDDLKIVLSVSEHTNDWLQNYPVSDLSPLPTAVDKAVFNVIFAHVDDACKGHLRALQCQLGSAALATLKTYFAQQNATVDTRVQRNWLNLRRHQDESATSFLGRFRYLTNEYHRSEKLTPLTDETQARHFLEGMLRHPAYDVLIQSFKTEMNQSERLGTKPPTFDDIEAAFLSLDEELNTDTWSNNRRNRQQANAAIVPSFRNDRK